MTTADLRPVVVEPARDRWGRPLVPQPGGGKPTAYTRCTTFVDVLEDKFNLQKWMQRMVAVGISTRQDLHLAAASMASDPDAHKAQLDEVCEKALEAARGGAKATIGTALHAFVERINLGQDPGIVPPEFRHHIANYRAVVERLGLRPIHVERFTVHDDLQIGGTPDLIAELAGHEGRFIVDLKTGPATLKYGALKVAMQLAVYTHSRLIDLGSGERFDIDGIRHDRGVVIALDSETGHCVAHWVDIAAGWEAVQVAAQVRQWRKRKDLLGELELPTLTAAAAVEADDRAAIHTALLNAIAQADSRDALTDLWTRSANHWSEIHTQAATARLEAIA